MPELAGNLTAPVWSGNNPWDLGALLAAAAAALLPDYLL